MSERAGTRDFLPWPTLSAARSVVDTWRPVGSARAFSHVPQPADWYCTPCRAWHGAEVQAMTEDTGPPGNILCAAAMDACSDGRAWLPWWEPPAVAGYRRAAAALNMPEADLAVHELGRIRYALLLSEPANPFARLHVYYTDKATDAVRERVHQITQSQTSILDL